MRPRRTKVPANARNSFGWVAERDNSDGLAYESARQVKRCRARTNGELATRCEQNRRFERPADKNETVSDGWQSGRMRRS